MFEFVEGKKSIIADLLSRIAECSMYKKNLPFVEETEAQLAAMQLRRGKTLLEQPRLRKRSTTPAPSIITTDKDDESDPEPSDVSTSTPVSTYVTDTTSKPEVESMAESTTPRLSLTTFAIEQYKELIIEGYKEDTQFKMALKAGTDSGIYVLKNGLLYTGPEKEQLCIPDIKVKGGRNGGDKSL